MLKFHHLEVLYHLMTLWLTLSEFFPKYLLDIQRRLDTTRSHHLQHFCFRIKSPILPVLSEPKPFQINYTNIKLKNHFAQQVILKNPFCFFNSYCITVIVKNIIGEKSFDVLQGNIRNKLKRWLLLLLLFTENFCISTEVLVHSN